MLLTDWLTTLPVRLKRSLRRRAMRQRRQAVPFYPTAAEVLEVRVMLSAVLAHDDSVSVNWQNQAIIVDVLKNDTTDPAPAAGTAAGLTIDSFTQGEHGIVTFIAADPNATGAASRDRLSFRPNIDYTGIDQFTYTAKDADGHLATATVTVYVSAPATPYTGGASPSIGGSNFQVDPRSSFTSPVTGNFEVSRQTAGLLDQTWDNGTTAAGTQESTHSVGATSDDNGDWTYIETVTWTYDLDSDPPPEGSGETSDVSGGYTYTLSASKAGGIITTTFSFTSNDWVNKSVSDVVTGATGHDVTWTFSSHQMQIVMITNTTNLDTGESWGMETQNTTVTSSTNSSGSYWRPTNGGALSGTTSSSGTTFDFSTYTVMWTLGSGGAWAALGQGMGVGWGSNGSQYNGAGSWSTAITGGTVSGSVEEAGSTTGGHNYNATAQLGSDLQWNVSGNGQSSGSSTGSWSANGTGSYSLSGQNVTTGDSGTVTTDWTKSGSVQQSASGSNSSHYAVAWSLGNNGWFSTDGNGAGNGRSNSSSISEGGGTYHTVGGGRDINGTFSESNQETQSNQYNTDSSLGAGGQWVTTGTASGSSMGSSQSSSDGVGTFFELLNVGSGGAAAVGAVSGSAWERGSQFNSYQNSSQYALGSDGNWILTGGEGETSSGNTSADGYDGTGGYGTGYTAPDGTGSWSKSGTVSKSGGKNSTSLQDTQVSVVNGEWKTVSGNGSGSGNASSRVTYEGSGQYAYASGGASVSGTMNEGGLNSDTSDWLTSSQWNGDGWTTIGTATSSNNGNSTYSQEGSGSYGSNGAGDLTGLASISGTIEENSGNDAIWSSESESTLSPTGAWVLAIGSGTNDATSYSHYSYSGGGSYGNGGTEDPQIGNWNVSGTVDESGSNDSRSEEHTVWGVADGNWVATSGSGSASGSTRNSSSYSGSGSYNLSRGGLTISGRVTNSGGKGDSSDYQTESTIGANGVWTTTGSGSGSTNASSNFSFTVGEESSYTRPISGGSIQGTITGFENERTNSNSRWDSTLSDNGQWVLSSGSGTYSHSFGKGTAYTGTGNYSISLSQTRDDGSTESWTLEGTIEEGGAVDNSNGQFERYDVVNGAWVLSSGGFSASGGSSDFFSNTGSGTYSRGGINGTYNRSESSSSSFRATQSGSLSGQTVTYAEQSATATGNSQQSWSYTGSGVQDYFGNVGMYQEYGNGNSQSNATLNFEFDDSEDGGWVPASGTKTESASGTSGVSFSGGNSSVEEGSSLDPDGLNGETWQLTVDSSLQFSRNDGGGRNSTYEWGVDDWVQTDGSGNGSGVVTFEHTVDGFGTYTATFPEGSMSGSRSFGTSSNFERNYMYTESYASGAAQWVATGSGSLAGSGGNYNASSGTGTYSRGSISGVVTQAQAYSFNYNARVDYLLGTSGWTVDSSEMNGDGTDGFDFSFSGEGAYTRATVGGSVAGTLTEAGNAHYSGSWNEISRMNGDGAWVLESGSGGGGGGSSYDYLASGEGTYVRPFDGSGEVAGTVTENSNKNWSETWTETSTVVNGRWNTIEIGSGSGNTGSSFQYNGTGSYDTTTTTGSGYSARDGSLTESGSISSVADSSWSWEAGTANPFFSFTRTTTNTSSHTNTYLNGGDWSFSSSTGDLSSGNGSSDSGGGNFDRSLNETFGSTDTTTYFYYEDLTSAWDTTSTFGTGQGMGQATFFSNSEWQSQAAQASDWHTRFEWMYTSDNTLAEDTYNYTNDWWSEGSTDYLTGASSWDGSSGSVLNTVTGSESSWGDWSSGWTESTFDSGSDAEASGGEWTTNGETYDSPYGPGGDSYNETNEGTGFRTPNFTGADGWQISGGGMYGLGGPAAPGGFPAKNFIGGPQMQAGVIDTSSLVGTLPILNGAPQDPLPVTIEIGGMAGRQEMHQNLETVLAQADTAVQKEQAAVAARETTWSDRIGRVAAGMVSGATSGAATGALVGGAVGAGVGSLAAGVGALPGAGAGALAGAWAGGIWGAISGIIEGATADSAADAAKSGLASGAIDGLISGATGGIGKPIQMAYNLAKLAKAGDAAAIAARAAKPGVLNFNWFLKGAESDAAWWSMGVINRGVAELGKTALSAAVFGPISHLSPLERGWAILRSPRLMLNAILNFWRGFAPEATGGLLETGPTAIWRYGWEQFGKYVWPHAGNAGHVISEIVDAMHRR